MKYGITSGFGETLNKFALSSLSFFVRYLQCIRCVLRTCKGPVRPRAARSLLPLLPDSAASPGAPLCHVQSVGGAWPNFRSSRGPYVRAQSHQTQVEMRPKSTHICVFFAIGGRGRAREKLLLTAVSGLCDRSPARRVPNAGARRSALMVRRVIRDVRRVVLTDNTDRLSRYGTYEQQVRGPSNPRPRRANANTRSCGKGSS